MGVAAYNRGSACIRKSISAGRRPVEFEFIEELNSLPKYEDAGNPLGDINFVFSRGVWWAECPLTGFGYFYKTLREAVKRWKVVITGFNGTFYTASKVKQ